MSEKWGEWKLENKTRLVNSTQIDGIRSLVIMTEGGGTTLKEEG